MLLTILALDDGEDVYRPVYASHTELLWWNQHH
jgi:hypothetical protein